MTIASTRPRSSLAAAAAALSLSACAATLAEENGALDPFHPQVYASVHGGPAAVTGVDLELVDIDAVKRDELDTDLGGTAALAIGVHLSPSWDIELEAGRTDSSGEIPAFGTFAEFDADFSWTAFMVNARYRPHPGHPWGPYMGAGLGYATAVELDLRRAGEGPIGIDGRDSAAVQLFLGAERTLSASVLGFAELRYFRSLDSESESYRGVVNGVTESRLRPKSTALLFGLRYRF